MSIGTLYASHSTSAGSAVFNSIPFHSSSIDHKKLEAGTMSFTSPTLLEEADRIRYQSENTDWGGQIYRRKLGTNKEYQYEAISYKRLYFDKVTVSFKNKTASQIMKKVLGKSKNNFRTSGIKNTELIHAYLKWEKTSIWDIACQLAWLEAQVGFIIQTYVDADGTLIFKYADEQQMGYNLTSVFDYTEDYDASDLITASSVVYNGKSVANAQASSSLIAKWGYVTEYEDCPVETGSSGTTTNTNTSNSEKSLKDTAQINKYKIPNQIVKQALEIAKPQNSQKANLKLLYNWCNSKIGYHRPMYYNTRYGALGTFKRRDGNCCDNAHVLIAMARSIGIKARYAHAHHNGKGHVWGEYKVDGNWFTCDTGTSSRTQHWGGHNNYAGSKTSNYDVLPF